MEPCYEDGTYQNIVHYAALKGRHKFLETVLIVPESEPDWEYRQRAGPSCRETAKAASTGSSDRSGGGPSIKALLDATLCS